jgi:hypothetical protein
MDPKRWDRVNATPYSCLSAVAGWTRVARRAGTAHAMAPMNSTTPIAAPNVTGSFGATLHSTR